MDYELIRIVWIAELARDYSDHFEFKREGESLSITCIKCGETLPGLLLFFYENPPEEAERRMRSHRCL